MVMEKEEEYENEEGDDLYWGVRKRQRMKREEMGLYRKGLLGFWVYNIITKMTL